MNTTTNNTQEETLFAINHPDIAIQRNPRAVLGGCTLIILSLGSLTGSFLLKDLSPTLSILALVISGLLIGYALYLLFGRNSYKVYRPTGSEVKEKTFFFEGTEKKALMESLENGDFYTTVLPQTSNNNGCIRLDILHSLDGIFAAAQLMEYEPYTFYPSSPIFYYEGEKARELKLYVAEMK